MEEVIGCSRSENTQTTNNIRQRQDVEMETGPISDCNGPSDEDLCTRTAPEMGYIFLEDCFLSVNVTGGLCRDDPVLFPTDRWIDVKLNSTKDPPHSPQHDEDKEKDKSALLENNCVDEGSCTRCSLILQEDEKGCLELHMESISQFDGRTSDMQCSDCRNRKRSDSALTMGLIAACGPEVAIRRLQVFFKDDAYRRAAIVVTVSFPFLLLGESGSRSVWSVPISGRKRHAKPIYPGLQLLLSIINSDWKNLDAAMQSIITDASGLRRSGASDSRDQRPSLFPPSLSLEDLYLRIQGSPRTQKLFEQQRNTQLKTQPLDCHLVRLPRDVVVDNLAPFLKAQSLDCLRCSCSYLHNTLRTVVPGLNLRLYSHQINSLSWMRTRESRSILETDCVGPSAVTPTERCYGDLHRAVTGGQSVLLSSRPATPGTPSIGIRVNQYTGYELELEQLQTIPRQVARGGLLCDDPGLGKTITVLSLILQTVGLSTDSASKESNAGEVGGPPDIKDIFKAYWRERMTRDFRLPTLLKLLNKIVRYLQLRANFPVAALRKAVAADKYEHTFTLFEEDMENAIQEVYPIKNGSSVSGALIDSFRAEISEFKEQQVRSAKKSHSNASSEVASLLEKQKCYTFIQSLVPSSATLLVIPRNLMDHWETQIQMHVNLRYCTDKKPLVYEYGKRGSKGMSLEEVITLCQIDKTHSPMIFLDKSGTRPLPPPSFLAMFQVVITTTNRFMNERNKGSFQQELHRLDMGDRIPAYSSFAVSDEACPLLKVHWLRMVVDEGHSMGRDKENSTIEFAFWITANRRWAMSGTPTKQSVAQLGQLLGLMRFLGHEFFTHRLEGEVTWKNNISKCWRDGHLAAFFRLRSMLGFLMSRHTKLDIAELPAPHFTTTVIPMSSTEVSTYNTLVGGVQSNLLITSMKGKISGEQDSFLHRSQARFAREALANIRRVCCGYTRVIPTLSDKFYREFVDLLQNKHNIPEEKLNELRRFVHHAETEGLSECSCCSMRLSVLLVQPCCGELICTECMDNATVTCYICGSGFDTDEFQVLQPGFELTWKSNLQEQKGKNLPPQGPVAPNALPAAQGAIDPSALPAVPGGDEVMALDVIHLPRDVQRTRKYGDGHVCEYSRLAGDGRCGKCLKEHELCNLINEKSRCDVCLRIAEDCPEDESKSSYLVSKLLELHRERRNRPVDPPDLGEFFPQFDGPRPLKAIVFSQFRKKALNVIGDRLLRRFGTACVAEYWGTNRDQELHRFVYEPACFCMLLSNDGSEGLDLSFVTHIFFLEEVWDKSLAEQAVARAWRMGAKGRVEVETLVAKNSVEETMQEFESAVNERSAGNVDAFDSSLSTLITTNTIEYQRTKTQTLLRTLRLNTDYHRFGQTHESDEARKSKADPSSTNALHNSPPAASEEPPPRKKTKTARVRFLD